MVGKISFVCSAKKFCSASLNEAYQISDPRSQIVRKIGLVCSEKSFASLKHTKFQVPGYKFMRKINFAFRTCCNIQTFWHPIVFLLLQTKAYISKVCDHSRSRMLSLSIIYKPKFQTNFLMSQRVPL